MIRPPTFMLASVGNPIRGKTFLTAGVKTLGQRNFGK
jgi:hypothetical protein